MEDYRLQIAFNTTRIQYQSEGQHSGQTNAKESEERKVQRTEENWPVRETKSQENVVSGSDTGHDNGVQCCI